MKPFRDILGERTVGRYISNFYDGHDFGIYLNPWNGRH